MPTTDPVGAYFNSVTYRGGPYYCPSWEDPEGFVWRDIADMTRSQHEQWRMRTHFDLLDADSD